MGFCNNCGEYCEKLTRCLADGIELLICDDCIESLRADNVLVLVCEEADENVQ